MKVFIEKIRIGEETGFYQKILEYCRGILVSHRGCWNKMSELPELTVSPTITSFALPPCTDPN